MIRFQLRSITAILFILLTLFGITNTFLTPSSHSLVHYPIQFPIQLVMPSVWIMSAPMKQPGRHKMASTSPGGIFIGMGGAGILRGY